MVISSLKSLPQSVWMHTSSGVYTVARGAKTTCNFIRQKAVWVKDNYLTRHFIYSKTHNAVKAKVLPLSNPPDWEGKMEKANEKLERLERLKAAKAHELTAIINNKSSKGSLYLARKTIQQQHTELLQNQHAKLQIKIETQKQYIDYLEKQRVAQVGSRFIGYVGMATNIALPGTGTAVGAALTGVSVAIQEQLAEDLPEDPTIKPQEQRSVHWGSCITIGCTIASIAFSYFALPAIKEKAYQMFK